MYLSVIYADVFLIRLKMIFEIQDGIENIWDLSGNCTSFTEKNLVVIKTPRNGDYFCANACACASRLYQSKMQCVKNS